MGSLQSDFIKKNDDQAFYVTEIEHYLNGTSISV